MSSPLELMAPVSLPHWVTALYVGPETFHAKFDALLDASSNPRAALPVASKAVRA